ncbi:unnamed protein product [Durusdinium trenchii]|uniref:U-box domain-containing protein n=2 Tax=Durusdinium trenchii TaxID=1381693 RepID=A0ABP0M3C3_9DINO
MRTFDGRPRQIYCILKLLFDGNSRWQDSAKESDLVEALTSVLKASMQRLAAVGTERQALRALQQGCGAAVRQALQKSQERQRRRHALEYSAVEVEVASKPRPKSEANQTSSKAPMPSEYFCPISQEVMVDPVTTSDGHTYDRKPIEEWLRNNDTSPNTGLVLPNKTLIPNHNLRKLIQEASTAKEDSIEMELDNMICAMEVEGPLPQGEGQEEEDQLDDAEGEEEEEEDDQLDDAEGAEEEEEEDQLDDAEGEPLDGVRGFEKLAAKMGDVISNATTSPGTSQSPGSSSVAETAEPQSHEEQRKLRRLSSWLRKIQWLRCGEVQGIYRTNKDHRWRSMRQLRSTRTVSRSSPDQTEDGGGACDQLTLKNSREALHQPPISPDGFGFPGTSKLDLFHLRRSLASMAFLTGVDLEGRVQDHQQLALPAPRTRRRRNKKLEEEEPLAIEAKPVEYSDLLRETMALEMDDSLEELRRMIKRTRNKMDTEMKVLDGFISDVNQIKGMQRSFEEPLAALPPNRSGSQPALKAPPHSMALQASSSAVALSESRRLPKRSTPLPALTHSQSTPAIGSAAMLALRSAQPLVLPKRRAPPFSQGRLRSELR